MLHTHNKVKITKIFMVFITLTSFTTKTVPDNNKAASKDIVSSKVLPPPYLSVKNFKKCLGTKKEDSYSVYCLPTTKPSLCPKESWKKLNEMDFVSCDSEKDT